MRINDRMIDFFTQKTRQRKQTSYKFNNSLHRDKEIKSALVSLFSNKCAYCDNEPSIVPSPTIDHFRPRQNAMNLDGSVYPDYYWWFAYKWENLYYSCENCHRSKRSRFPVEGKRVGRMGSVKEEQALLIDPCNSDDFINPHFKISERGVLSPLTKKGEITLEILNLNRTALCEAREERISAVKKILSANPQTIELNVSDNVLNFFDKILSKDSVYLSTTVAAFRYYSAIIKFNSKEFKDVVQQVLEKTAQIVTSIQMDDVEDIQYKARFEKEKFSYSLESETASVEEKEAYFSSAKRIEKLEIKNFKIIRNLTLNFPKSQLDEEAWLTLLGENGSGKSSVLQAIALTLSGENYANNLGLDASQFVNKNTRSRSGYVRVYFKGLPNYLELRFSKDSRTFEFNYTDAKVILLAFGSTRLMAQEMNSDVENNLRNLHNLFNPFAPLPNIEQWIGDPKQVDVSQFDQIATELKKILQLPEDKLIYRRKVNYKKYELFIKLKGEKHGTRISDLSAGYKAVISMTLNIIREVLKIWDHFKIAEGVVLIDEIGVHLHPKWKMKIITHLREIFPSMTFIITTHEPLCLRGINKGEVALMKFDENNQVIALTDLPSPKSLTVEQLICSKFFGLITSFDPEVERQLNSYYLLQSKNDLSENELEQLELLKQELEDVRMMDSDLLSEQKDIDEMLSKESNTLDSGWVANPKHQEKLMERIKDIWATKN